MNDNQTWQNPSTFIDSRKIFGLFANQSKLPNRSSMHKLLNKTKSPSRTIYSILYIFLVFHFCVWKPYNTITLQYCHSIFPRWLSSILLCQKTVALPISKAFSSDYFVSYISYALFYAVYLLYDTHTWIQSKYWWTIR